MMSKDSKRAADQAKLAKERAEARETHDAYKIARSRRDGLDAHKKANEVRKDKGK